MKKLLITIIVLLAAAGAWYLGSPLFLNETVDEPLPFANITTEDFEEMKEMAEELKVSLPTIEEVKEMTQEAKNELEEMLLEKGMEMPDKIMEEEMPAEEPTAPEGPTLLSLGAFVDADKFHAGSGDAKILKLADGSTILRLEDFSVTNGPDLRVLLAKHGGPITREEVDQGYLELGKLKGNKGNQNYTIPAGTNLDEYKSVVIYCKPFHVVFSSATLAK